MDLRSYYERVFTFALRLKTEETVHCSLIHWFFCHGCSSATESSTAVTTHFPSRGQCHTNTELGDRRQRGREVSMSRLVQSETPTIWSKWGSVWPGSSAAAVIIYRCGPAALIMEGAEGAPAPNRLIFCQTTNTVFDVACFLLAEVVSLPAVANSSGWQIHIQFFKSGSTVFFFFFCYKTRYIQKVIHSSWIKKLVFF